MNVIRTIREMKTNIFRPRFRWLYTYDIDKNSNEFFMYIKDIMKCVKERTYSDLYIVDMDGVSMLYLINGGEIKAAPRKLLDCEINNLISCIDTCEDEFILKSLRQMPLKLNSFISLVLLSFSEVNGFSSIHHRKDRRLFQTNYRYRFCIDDMGYVYYNIKSSSSSFKDAVLVKVSYDIFYDLLKSCELLRGGRID